MGGDNVGRRFCVRSEGGVVCGTGVAVFILRDGGRYVWVGGEGPRFRPRANGGVVFKLVLLARVVGISG